MKWYQNPDLGLLLVRIALGLVFIVHGWQKVSNLTGTVGFFGSIGLPAFLAYVVAAIEFLGGLAILLGVWTRVVGVLLAAVMVGAIVTLKFKAGFSGGYEFDLTLLLIALAMSFSGPGRYALCRSGLKSAQA